MEEKSTTPESGPVAEFLDRVSRNTVVSEDRYTVLGVHRDVPDGAWDCVSLDRLTDVHATRDLHVPETIPT
jgi:hypothetical protein